MRDEARVIQLDEWAARVNAETRAFMGVSVAPEIPERQQARAYLAGLMGDQEAAARVAADLERVCDDLAVKNLTAEGAEPAEDDGSAVQNLTNADAAWSALGWQDAAAEYHKDRAGSTLIIETDPERLARARRLLADDVSLERAWHQLNKPAGVAASTLMAAEHLVRQNDPEPLQRWLAKHGADERKAIQKHLGGKHAAKPRTD